MKLLHLFKCLTDDIVQNYCVSIGREGVVFRFKKCDVPYQGNCCIIETGCHMNSKNYFPPGGETLLTFTHENEKRQIIFHIIEFRKIVQ